MRLAAALAVLLCATISLAGCGSQNDPSDQDDDDMNDALERGGWEIFIDLVGHRVLRQVSSDPTMADTDGDGIPDAFEYALGLDPRDPDTDQDGLSDCEEGFHSNRTTCEDPEKSDWLAGNNDGGTGTDPRNADSDPGGGRYVNDVLGYVDDTGKLGLAWIPWGDGIADGDELRGFSWTGPSGSSKRVQTDPMQADSDLDGLDDGEEAFIFHSDPQVKDTDSDGCEDGRDIFPARAEKYEPGLRSFRLNASAPEEVPVHFVVSLMGTIYHLPDNGSVQARPGEWTNLTAIPVVPRGGACEYVPYDPWVFVQVEARDTSSGWGLDISGDGDASFWWNPREGTFTLQRLEGPVTPHVEFHGRDGALLLSPTVPDSS